MSQDSLLDTRPGIAASEHLTYRLSLPLPPMCPAWKGATVLGARNSLDIPTPCPLIAGERGRGSGRSADHGDGDQGQRPGHG